MTQSFAGFMSYVRVDDQHENGRLTELCARLSGEVRMQLGEEFAIFQDRNDIAWGQQWKKRIENSIDATTFLIPIITPSFFKSPACRDEVERFLARENDLGRSDLILPIYYVNCPILNDELLRSNDGMAQIIASRQRADWRELRFEPFTAPPVGKTLAALAGQIVQALQQVRLEPGGSVMSQNTASNQQEVAETGVAAVSIELIRRAFVNRLEAPTIVVDPLHRGDFLTLTEAMHAAQPGNRILVRPGLYREGLVVDKPVEIIGDGEPGEVVIEASGQDGILFQTSMGRAVNLTIRQMGGGKWYGVDIAQGRLDLEGCDITSMSLACVAIHGGADPRLRRNRMHDGRASGIVVFENGLGTLEDNEIFANAFAGVEVRSGGNPILRRNRIYNGKTSGVFVHTSGLGVLEDNEIFGNASSGVMIKSGGNPTLRRNRIYEGRSTGVFIFEGGLGTLEDNDIFANAFAGVEIRAEGNPTLCRNQIHDGKQSGVFIHQAGLGVLEDNEIFTNALVGVMIKSEGNPTLRRNRIRDGKQSGVLVRENGLGTLERNEIFGNAYAGITVHSGGNPMIRRNTISKNGYEAVWVYEGGRGVIEDNNLVGNVRGALDIDESCKDFVQVRRNDG